MERRSTMNLLWPRLVRVILLAALVAVFGKAALVNAGTDDVLFGVASSMTPINPDVVDSTNFSANFTYNGEDSASLTMGGGQGDAQIGAIYTGGEAEMWYQVRIIIDSNGDGVLTPFDWSNPSHPWNMQSGTWQYPEGYPGDTYDNGNNDGTIDFDAGESFPFDTFQWWWYEANYDRTDNRWVESGELMNMGWSGRDQEWNVLPNGDYKARVWVDENNDGEFADDEANKTLIIAIETASITGTVVDSNDQPIQGAEVEAGSFKAWGQARTNASGVFTVSGLQAGAVYNVRVRATGKVTKEMNDINLPDGETSADAGTITMSDAVAITGTIKLDRNANEVTDEEADQFEAFTNQWGWEQFDMMVFVNANNTNGPGWGNTDVRFEEGDSSATFTINIPPPAASTTYQLNINAPGYAASSNPQVAVTAEGGDAGEIILTKASILTGSVKLPAAVSGWNNIDVQAVSIADSDTRYWGWGQIDGNMEPTDTGTFTIDGIPAGEYNLEIRVMGYATATQQIEVLQGVDTDVGEIAISTGNKITGTLTILGDTTDVMTGPKGDLGDGLSIWVDAWSPSAGGSGAEVQVTRGVNQSASFSIGGLSTGTYEIHAFIGDGYELVDENDNAPVYVTLSSTTASKNIILRPYSGVVSGTVSGPGSLDLSKVVVEVKRPWDWLPPKIATVANGGINGSTGAYSVSGLGTGDYVVKAGMYDGWMNYAGEQADNLDEYEGEGWLMPNAALGVVIERIFIQNSSSTTKNIAFEQGYSISGTVSLSETDRPWHDANGNGKKDTNVDPNLSEAISMSADIVGQQVMAMPMDMMFMGGSDPRMGTIQADGTYLIPGLTPGVYVIQPPFSSPRISQLDANGSPAEDAKYFEGDQSTHHWTANTKMVVVSDDDETGVNFCFGNGYTVTGTLTLPEAQTYTEGDWSEWWWVGQLELTTATSQSMGHGKPLFKRDFNNTNKYNFTFNHVANGDYLVRFWTDRYVPAGEKLTVSSADTSVSLTIEEGANIVGKLVDADTGQAVTSSDGIMVRCEAFPNVEGSWRETRDDDWSLSYIENDLGIQTGNIGGQNGERENSTPGKFHLNSLPTGHKYVVVVEASHGEKTNGAKNYVGQIKAGIDIPEGATGDIDVGTIKLKEGTTITGRLTDANGAPIPGINVVAMPSNNHDGSAEGEGTSDTNGYYTVYGINPEVEYYDLKVAERPFMFDAWGKTVEWGEKRKYNVAPGSTGVNFTLGATTASLSGTITIPPLVGDTYNEDVDVRFMLPFKGEGEEFPAATIILQRKGVIYKDVLDGIEEMTTPRPASARTATYDIDNLEPGTYKIFYMNFGLPTLVYDNVVISAGTNSKNVTWDSTGYSVSGDVALSGGGYPSSSDITGVLCMNTLNKSLIFGELTQEADDTYSAYLVPGLADGATYQLVFYKDTGDEGMPDVFAVGVPFTISGEDVTDNTATISRNGEPLLMVQAIQNQNNASLINVAIFSSTYLVDSSISVVDEEPTSDSTAGEIYIKTGDGSLSDVELSGDKRRISATYTKDENDTTVELVLAVHYGDEATTKLKTLSFNINALAANADVVDPYSAGQIKLGNGDASQIFIPAGAFESSDNTELEVTISKSDEEPGALEGSGEAENHGIFADALENALPAGVTVEGDLYDFHVDGTNDYAEVDQQGTVTIQVQYDPDEVTDPDEIDIWHFTDGAWTAETTNRTVDEENHTISVEVSSLSPFVVGKSASVEPLCVYPKADAANALCKAYLSAVAKWVKTQDDAAFAVAVLKAETKFSAKWSKAVQKAVSKGKDCTDVEADTVRGTVEDALDALKTAIAAGIDDLGTNKYAKAFGQALAKAAKARCCSYLKAESSNVKSENTTKRDAAKSKADTKFASGWTKAAGKATAKEVTYSISDTDISGAIDTLVEAIFIDLESPLD